MQTSYPGSRSLITQALTKRKVPGASINICLASITESTLKQYNSGLKYWWRFCTDNKIDLFEPSIQDILQFLTQKFNKGASYSTLNSLRSAIAQIVTCDMSADNRIRRFFKGVYGLRPSQPKYDYTWNPSVVITYTRTLNLEKLEELTERLSMLLALATGQRVQTLANIQLDNITINRDDVVIKISNRLKTSGPKKTQPILYLPFLSDDPEICVATILRKYLNKTEPLRKQDTQNLFITIKKPHHNATAQTISRWLKNVLRKSGIDTSIFSSHSTRHSSTSTAARRGINIDQIRTCAGWSNTSSVFAKFYQRPITDRGEFSKTVLKLD